ncbi:PAS and ANTAR domain-containing protein [Nocardia fluminea]|uniref:PAS and ANTAR domain-containing protein n=1 Tax=Nocardia fluminea TaxID=134984 RepID=UPI0033CE0B58
MTEPAPDDVGRDDDERLARVYRPAHVGRFTFWFTTGRWEWSPEMYRMHGYAPGEVEPTTELLLSHKHPDDRDVLAGLISRTLTQGGPSSSRQRFLDTTGHAHTVMVLADRLLDDYGEPVATTGYYLDLSETVDAVATAAANEAIAEVLSEVVAARSVIEQAKGVLMQMYGMNAEQAFKVLVWRSQDANIKLRDIAVQVIEDLRLLPPPDPKTIAVFDHLLLTGHERIVCDHES